MFQKKENRNLRNKSAKKHGLKKLCIGETQDLKKTLFS